MPSPTDITVRLAKGLDHLTSDDISEALEEIMVLRVEVSLLERDLESAKEILNAQERTPMP